MQTELLTIPQFCEVANCGRNRAYQLIGSNQIPAFKQGKKTLIKRSDMEAWIKTLQPYASKKAED